MGTQKVKRIPENTDGRPGKKKTHKQGDIRRKSLQHVDVAENRRTLPSLSKPLLSEEQGSPIKITNY